MESSHPKRATKHYAIAIEHDALNEDAWQALERVLLRTGDKEWIGTIKSRLEAAGRPTVRLDDIARRIDARGDLNDPVQFVAALLRTPDHPSIRSNIGRFLGSGGLRPARRSGDIEDQLARLPLPTHIRIETASACNLRCQHCTTGVAYKSTDRRVMSIGTFDRVLDQVRALPTIRTAIMYLGGEPLLNRTTRPCAAGSRRRRRSRPSSSSPTECCSPKNGATRSRRPTWTAFTSRSTAARRKRTIAFAAARRTRPSATTFGCWRVGCTRPGAARRSGSATPSSGDPTI